MSKNQRVVVTGIGVILPNAFSVDTFWDHLKNGKSQIDYITKYPIEAESVKVAAEIKNFSHTDFLPDLDPRFAKRYNRETLVTISAVKNSLDDAKIGKNNFDRTRIGFIDSSSRSSMEWWVDSFDKHYTGTEKSPFDRGAILGSLPSSPATMSAIYNNIQGFVTMLSGACVGGHQSVILATQYIKDGHADIMLAGGHDFPIMQSMLKIYSDPEGRPLSFEKDNPKAAVKPYDKKRDGTALGEGSIVVCLENYEHAIRRGARIYSEIKSYHSFNEANHPFLMDLTGDQTANGVMKLLEKANLGVNDIDLFCGHGTGTKTNDVAETRALKTIYSSRKVNELPPMISLKPIFGHIFGASGVINIAGSSLMIFNDTIAPTINHTEPDEECNNDHVSEGFRNTKLKNVVSLAFSLGSQCSFLAVGKPD